MREFWKENKKGRAIVSGVVAVLLVAGLFRLATERVFLAQASMQGAFSVLTPDERKGTVTLTGRYLPPPYGFSKDKLLHYFGDEIGLLVEGNLREVCYEGRQEFVYEKVAAEAETLVKIVYLTEEEEYYICAEVTLTGSNADGITTFQQTVKSAAEKLQLKDITTTLELCGTYKGEIPLGEKDRLTDCLLRELYAQPVYENRENANYTVYAYTGAVEEYIVVEKKKINVQIAVYYNKEADCTELVLASPIGLR